jgi:hypothetical protein
MAKVSDDEVLLLWRALMAYRSGPRPACRAQGKPPCSPCPLHTQCPRWGGGPDDYLAVMEETPEQTETRRAGWPCTRLADLLSPRAEEHRARLSRAIQPSP